MSLLALQRDVRAWLRSQCPEAASRIGGDAALAGLQVHRGNHRASLTACLDESFARARDWIGETAFAAAAGAHILCIPPSSWTLDAYPRDFPATLAILYRDDPEVAELAWLDLALAEAFVAPDAAVPDAATIAAVDWDTAVLRFGPSLEIGEARTNAAAIWSALAAGEAPPAAALLPEPAAMLVWRRDGVSCFRSIKRDEQRALLLARAGTPFAELCAALVADVGEANGVAMAGAFLGRWIADGLLSGFTTGDRSCAAR